MNIFLLFLDSKVLSGDRRWFLPPFSLAKFGTNLLGLRVLVVLKRLGISHCSVWDVFYYQMNKAFYRLNDTCKNKLSVVEFKKLR